MILIPTRRKMVPVLLLEGADDILGLYRKMQEERQKAEQELKQSADFVPLEATFSNKEQEVPEKMMRRRNR